MSDSPELVVYCGRTAPTLEPLFDRFREQTGVRMQVWIDDQRIVRQRLEDERDAPAADVLICTNSIDPTELADAGALAPYLPAATARWPAGFLDVHGRWVAFVGWPRAIVYQPASIVDDGLPRSIFDLTAPQWRGCIGLGGVLEHFTITQIAALIAVRDERFAAGYLHQLRSNDVRIYEHNHLLRVAIAEGAVAAGLMSYPNYVLQRQRGSAVGAIIPDQTLDQIGAVVNAHCIALVDGAPHEPAARSLIDYFTSVEAQRLLASIAGECPLHPDAQDAALIPLESIRQIGVPLTSLAPYLPSARALLANAGIGTTA